jgi:hypothetical protein
LVSSVNTPYPHYGWIPANHLKPGDHLKTPDGQSAVVVGGSIPAVHDGWMWDLTVPGNNDHDFYVVTGATPVLVHNSSPGCELGPNGWPKPTMDNCEACAQKIQDKIGGEIYQISDSMGAPRLGPSVNDPNGQWFEHFAVIKDGTVYDGFTGPRGMPFDDYRAQWDYGEYLKFTPYNPGG